MPGSSERPSVAGAGGGLQRWEQVKPEERLPLDWEVL